MNSAFHTKSVRPTASVCVHNSPCAVWRRFGWCGKTDTNHQTFTHRFAFVWRDVAWRNISPVCIPHVTNAPQTWKTKKKIPRVIATGSKQVNINAATHILPLAIDKLKHLASGGILNIVELYTHTQSIHEKGTTTMITPVLGGCFLSSEYLRIKPPTSILSNQHLLFFSPSATVRISWQRRAFYGYPCCRLV